MQTADFDNFFLRLLEIKFSPQRNEQHENIACLKLHDLVWDNTPSADTHKYETVCYALYDASRITDNDWAAAAFHQEKNKAFQLFNLN
jgi:hypothetical protein